MQSRFAAGSQKKRTWTDIAELAQDLAKQYRHRDPLMVKLPELRKLVAQLPTFGDNPDAATDAVLEAIRSAWYDEYEE